MWIPKAKAGPTADHFRPLGMSNTIDRSVDGSIAAYVMRHTAHLMHSSQAVMSYFKDPQKAVSASRGSLMETALPVFYSLIYLRPLKESIRTGY